MSISYFTDEAIFSAGAVLLNKQDKKVCLIYKNATDEWLLPKGHIKSGETIEDATQREIFEETGYQGVIKDLLSVQVRPDVKEPLKNKVIFWFLATLLSPTQTENTQTEDESFTSAWKSEEEATSLLTWDEDKKLIKKAYSKIDEDK